MVWLSIHPKHSQKIQLLEREIAAVLPLQSFGLTRTGMPNPGYHMGGLGTARLVTFLLESVCLRDR